MAYHDWQKLPDHFQYMELGAFKFMPNHLHGIINNFHPEKSLYISPNTQFLDYCLKIQPIRIPQYYISDLTRQTET